jgi:hypothetical protein
MTLPVAGWYDDPAGSERLRWWTGTEWGEARDRRDVPEAPVEHPLPYGPASTTASPVPVPAPAPAPAGFRQLWRNNPLAFVGALLGLVAVLIDTFGGVAVLALIFGVRGVVRATELKSRGAPVTGQAWAIAALALTALVVARFVTEFFR